MMKFSLAFIVSVTFLLSCATIKDGESWKMRAEDKTIGLTLLWNLPEEKLKEMLPPNQMPRIQNGKGVLMVFLCSTDRYSVGQKNYGQLGVAHLIIPLKDAISLPETIGLKNQAIITGLKKKGFPARFGDIKLQLEEVGDSVRVKGDLILATGEMHFSGIAENKKGNLVSLKNTTLLGVDLQKDVLSGPEYYNPIAFKSITIKQSGENWIEKYNLNSAPDRIWVNVDFGVDFKYTASRATHFATPAVK
jgi:hypothetical protein